MRCFFSGWNARPALSLTGLDAVLGDVFHSLQHALLRLSRLLQLQVQQLSEIIRLLPLTNLQEEKLRSGTPLRGRDTREAVVIASLFFTPQTL